MQLKFNSVHLQKFSKHNCSRIVITRIKQMENIYMTRFSVIGRINVAKKAENVKGTLKFFI